LKKVQINKKGTKCYISPICPEVPSGWICTKFGLGGPLTDIIKLCGILLQSAQGFWNLLFPIDLDGRR